jgi:hypothetical protein
MTRRPWPAFALAWIVAVSAAAQTPEPFPKPGDPSQPQATRPPGTQPPPKTSTPAPPTSTSPAPGDPTERTLGVAIYPGAQFVASYDAGRGQRYYLFGTSAGFAEIVAYYRTLLKQRGEVVFELPAVHMFEVGRFREETMAFPPSVTVKDYTFGGSEGYINPKRGAQPTHFRTIIQIVPAPAGAGAGK